MSDAPLLHVHGLCKRFGGVRATDGIDLRVAAGEVHALIGPNGAGKTTLVAQLAGQLAPDSGRIVFDGVDITAWRAHQRARRGLARSFQITRLFGSFSVVEHIALALQAARGSSFGAWRPLARERALWEQARAQLGVLGLQDHAEASIDTLSHGQRRALEVGMAVAGAPRMVLLDEPMAGMGPDESARMEALIAEVARRTTVLLIEHDVDAVFRLAHRVSVLVSGRVIASAAPGEVRRDPQVIAAYLGQE
ncbi:MAG TPA: ABC transporter ATP-binding protein [Burkholderiaceae bacterium]|nr:ABC transporter ATP-binding protein [Burkholderiaceae bacterium]